MDPLAVLQCHARVQQGRRLVGFGQEVLQFGLAAFKPLHVFYDGFDWPAGLDRGQQLGQLAVDLLDLGLG
ncbi:hypothetical protein [Paracoccus sp. SSJ]|uniref:hypothetical protein n=1 Tax=Paracoccus sp. SSJ TaxID=3050636 RepID=UPI0033074014